MPKMKTHSGAKKRFKVTGSGKVKRAAAGKNHFLRRKSKSAKRRLNRDSFVDKTNLGAVRAYLNI